MYEQKHLVTPEAKQKSMLSERFIKPLKEILRQPLRLQSLRKVLDLLKEAPRVEQILTGSNSGIEAFENAKISVASESVTDFEHDSGLVQLGKELKYPSHFKYCEDVTEKLEKLDRNSEGTSESFWAIDRTSGVTFYMKTEQEEDKLRTELLADLIYRKMGIPVANKQLVIYGEKLWLASEELVDAKPCYLSELKKLSSQLREGFVLDALLANRDVFGLISNSNILEKDGVLYRVDNGSSFVHRGRHGKKKYSEVACPEIDSLRDEENTAGKVYTKVDSQVIKKQVQLITHVLNEETIRTLASSVYGQNSKIADVLVASLQGRIQYLYDRFVTGEGEKDLQRLASVSSLAETVQTEVKNIVAILTKATDQIIQFRQDHSAEFNEIRQQQHSPAEVLPDQDWMSSPIDVTTMKRWNLLRDLDEIIPKNEELDISQDANCTELISAKDAYFKALNEVKQELGEREVQFNAEEAVTRLTRNIEQESIGVNEELAAHVTGFEDLLKILKSGKLMSKAKQIQLTGQSQAKVTSKSSAEMHQVVFDRKKIRPEYSAPENVSKVPPVVFIVPSVHLLSSYQGMESDGWHAFGLNHNEQNNQLDDFSIDVGDSQLAILVPEEYMEQLRQHLKQFLKDSETIEGIEQRMQIAYMPRACYRDAESGRLLTSMDLIKAGSPLEQMYGLARSILPKNSFRRGRISRTGNLGHGSASWNKPLSRFFS